MCPLPVRESINKTHYCMFKILGSKWKKSSKPVLCLAPESLSGRSVHCFQFQSIHQLSGKNHPRNGKGVRFHSNFRDHLKLKKSRLYLHLHPLADQLLMQGNKHRNYKREGSKKKKQSRKIYIQHTCKNTPINNVAILSLDVLS